MSLSQSQELITSLVKHFGAQGEQQSSQGASVSLPIDLRKLVQENFGPRILENGGEALFTAQALKELMASLGGNGDTPGLWCFLDFELFALLANIILKTEVCFAKDEGLCRLVEAFEVLKSSSRWRSSDHENLGKAILEPLLKQFLSEKETALSKRWLGSLLAAILEKLENRQMINKLSDGVYQNLLRIIVEGTDKLLKIVAGRLFGRLSISFKESDLRSIVERCWPKKHLYMSKGFPLNLKDTANWEDAFMEFLNDVETQLYELGMMYVSGISPEVIYRTDQKRAPMDFNGLHVQLGYGEKLNPIEGGITCSVTEFFSIYVPPPKGSTATAEWIDINILNIEKIEIKGNGFESQDVTRFILRLKDNAGDGYLYLSSMRKMSDFDCITILCYADEAEEVARDVLRRRDEERHKIGMFPPMSSAPIKDIPAHPRRTLSEREKVEDLHRRREHVARAVESPNETTSEPVIHDSLEESADAITLLQPSSVRAGAEGGSAPRFVEESPEKSGISIPSLAIDHPDAPENSEEMVVRETPPSALQTKKKPAKPAPAADFLLGDILSQQVVSAKGKLTENLATKEGNTPLLAEKMNGKPIIAKRKSISPTKKAPKPNFAGKQANLGSPFHSNIPEEEISKAAEVAKERVPAKKTPISKSPGDGKKTTTVSKKPNIATKPPIANSANGPRKSVAAASGDIYDIPEEKESQNPVIAPKKQMAAKKTPIIKSLKNQQNPNIAAKTSIASHMGKQKKSAAPANDDVFDLPDGENEGKPQKTSKKGKVGRKPNAQKKEPAKPTKPTTSKAPAKKAAPKKATKVQKPGARIESADVAEGEEEIPAGSVNAQSIRKTGCAIETPQALRKPINIDLDRHATIESSSEDSEFENPPVKKLKKQEPPATNAIPQRKRRQAAVKAAMKLVEPESSSDESEETSSQSSESSDDESVVSNKVTEGAAEGATKELTKGDAKIPRNNRANSERTVAQTAINRPIESASPPPSRTKPLDKNSTGKIISTPQLKIDFGRKKKTENHQEIVLHATDSSKTLLKQHGANVGISLNPATTSFLELFESRESSENLLPMDCNSRLSSEPPILASTANPEQIVDRPSVRVTNGDSKGQLTENFSHEVEDSQSSRSFAITNTPSENQQISNHNYFHDSEEKPEEEPQDQRTKIQSTLKRKAPTPISHLARSSKIAEIDKSITPNRLVDDHLARKAQIISWSPQGPVNQGKLLRREAKLTAIKETPPQSSGSPNILTYSPIRRNSGAIIFASEDEDKVIRRSDFKISKQMGKGKVKVEVGETGSPIVISSREQSAEALESSDDYFSAVKREHSDEIPIHILSSDSESDLNDDAAVDIVTETNDDDTDRETPESMAEINKEATPPISEENQTSEQPVQKQHSAQFSEYEDNQNLVQNRLCISLPPNNAVYSFPNIRGNLTHPKIDDRIKESLNKHPVAGKTVENTIRQESEKIKSLKAAYKKKSPSPITPAAKFQPQTDPDRTLVNTNKKLVYGVNKSVDNQPRKSLSTAKGNKRPRFLLSEDSADSSSIDDAWNSKNRGSVTAWREAVPPEYDETLEVLDKITKGLLNYLRSGEEMAMQVIEDFEVQGNNLIRQLGEKHQQAFNEFKNVIEDGKRIVENDQKSIRRDLQQKAENNRKRKMADLKKGIESEYSRMQREINELKRRRK
ncbi:hypothetical protein RUND412_004369 [Rhizina undulata]